MNEYVSRKQIIVTPDLVHAYLDEVGRQHQRPAIIWGEFYSPIAQGIPNTPPGTRIDYQSAIFKELPEDRITFGIKIDPEDTDQTIITTSKPLTFFHVNIIRVPGFPIHHGLATNVYLTCAVHIRDATTWQPIRYEYEKQIGTGTNKKKTKIVIRDDIEPWHITEYSRNGLVMRMSNNLAEVQQQCRFYADATAKTFEVLKTKTRNYIGLYPIDLDGAIQQVSYHLSKSGFDTTVSRNTEHDFDIPSYDERQQRIARTNIDQKVAYWNVRQLRLLKLQGTHDT